MIKSNKKSISGILMLMASATLWSFGGVLVKGIPWHPIAISGIRSAVSVVVLIIIFRKIRFKWDFKILAAAVSYMGIVLTFVLSTSMTTAANAITLQYTSPFFILLAGAAFFSIKLKKKDILFVLLSMLGLLLLMMSRIDKGQILGSIIGVLCGISSAFYVLFCYKLDNSQAKGALILGNVLTVLISIPFLMKNEFTPATFAVVSLAGLLQYTLPYLLYTMAISKVVPVDAALITMLEIVLNPLWVFFIVGEKPGIFTILGAVVITISMILRVRMIAKAAGKLR